MNDTALCFIFGLIFLWMLLIIRLASNWPRVRRTRGNPLRPMLLAMMKASKTFWRVK